MGRLSKKEVEKRKEAKQKKILGYLLESLLGGLVFTLLLYILIGDDTTINIIEYVQENALTVKLLIASFPISTLIIFAADIARETLNGNIDK